MRMAGKGDMVRWERRGNVAVVVMSRPPVNALNGALMAELAEELTEAAADPATVALVLTTEGTGFSAGLDVSELGKVKGAALPALCSRIETLPKPLVVALTGNVLGGAMELALAAHGRVAHVGARLGLPEVALGLAPVAGSTQRLPRLVGAEVACRLLLDGQPLTATEALAVGLLDAVVEEPPLARALALAETLAAQPPRRVSERAEGLRDPVSFQAAITAARRRIEGWRLPAPARLVDCVEAAQLLPFDMGLRFEQAAAEDLSTSPEAQGLRHAFLCERRAQLPPQEIAAVAPPPLAAVAFVGAGLNAPEVARMALAAGLRVTLVEADRPALAAALQKIATRHQALLAEGSLTEAQRDADWGRLSGVLASDGVQGVDLILVSPEAPRLANLPAPTIGLGGRGPVVLHPAGQSGGLAEISRTGTPAPALQAAALAFARRLGWKVMFQGPGASIDQRLRAALSRAIAQLETQGLDRAAIAAALAAFGLGAGNRPRLPASPAGGAETLAFALAAMTNEGLKLLAEGAARRPGDVDAASLLSGLFPRWEGGPMFHADRIGLMALRSDLRRRAESLPRLFAPPPLLDQLIADGRKLADLNG